MEIHKKLRLPWRTRYSRWWAILFDAYWHLQYIYGILYLQYERWLQHFLTFTNFAPSFVGSYICLLIVSDGAISWMWVKSFNFVQSFENRCCESNNLWLNLIVLSFLIFWTILHFTMGCQHSFWPKDFGFGDHSPDSVN